MKWSAVSCHDKHAAQNMVNRKMNRLQEIQSPAASHQLSPAKHHEAHAWSWNLWLVSACIMWLIVLALTEQVFVIFSSDEALVPNKIPCLCVWSGWWRPLESTHISLCFFMWPSLGGTLYSLLLWMFSSSHYYFTHDFENEVQCEWSASWFID